MLAIPKIDYDLSPAQRLAFMPNAEQAAFFESLSEDEAMVLEYDWQHFWARPKQLVPPLGDWDIWLFMGGRGIGKTRTGVEAARFLVYECGYRWLSIVGRTAADVRDVLIEGESGFLNVLPEWELPLYEPSKRRLTFPNGAIANLFSADEPDQMRGPQSDLVLADEVAAWRFAGSFDQVSFGNRLGQKPIMILLTTPQPNKLMRELVEDSIPVEEYLGTGDMRGKTVLLTTGSTYENAANLAPKFLKRLVKKYDGTRLGRQEIYAQMLLDTPGALWKLDLIEKHRVTQHPLLKRIAIAIDPPGRDNSDNESGAEAGIIAAGIGIDGQGYLLEDASIYGSPAEWGRQALSLYYKYKADVMVGEVNNGGDMVEHTVMSVVEKGQQRPNFKQVRASRGKLTRAEPISALYEKGEVHHVGAFKELEDQMTTWVPGEKSPDRCFAAGTMISTKSGDRPIEEICVGDLVLTREGYKRVLASGRTSERSLVLQLTLSCGIILECTSNHPIFVYGRGFIPAWTIQKQDQVAVLESKLSSSMEMNIDVTPITGASRHRGIFTHTKMAIGRTANQHSILLFGNITMGLFQKVILFITVIKVLMITVCQILKWSLAKNMGKDIAGTISNKELSKWIMLEILPLSGMVAMSVLNGTLNTAKSRGKIGNALQGLFVRNVEKKHSLIMTNEETFASALVGVSIDTMNVPSDIMKTVGALSAGTHSMSRRAKNSKFVPVNVLGLCVAQDKPVYNIAVEDERHYFANGVLVHNCDAAVWALTELMVDAEPEREYKVVKSRFRRG